MTLLNSVDNLVLRNPLIRRYHCSSFRLSHLWVYATIYFVVTVLLLFINIAGSDWARDATVGGAFFRSLYHQFLIMEIGVLWVWSALNSRAALNDEVANKTYDFFYLLPLSALQKLMGILIGKNLVTLLLAGVTLVPLTLFALFADISLAGQVDVLLVLFSVALCTNAVALLSSAISPRQQRKTSTGVWILFALLIGPAFLGPLLMGLHEIAPAPEKGIVRIAFYSAEIPIPLVVSALALYFDLWSVLGILRKFTNDGVPLFSRAGALLFLLGYEVVVFGFFFSHLPDGAASLSFVWLIVSLLPVMLLPVGSANDYAYYLEACGRAAASPGSSGKTMAWRFAWYSNLTLGLLLFVLWSVFYVVTAVICKVSPGTFLPDALVLASAYLFLQLLLEVYVMYRPAYGKIGILLAFVLLLYLFLPVILSLTLEAPVLRFFSPFVYMANFMAVDTSECVETWGYVLAANVLLCVIPAEVLRRRYTEILALRRTM